MSKVLEVSRNAYYNWKKDRQASKKRFRELLIAEIKKVYKLSRCIYGSPRISRELIKRGFKASQQYVARIMREEGLRSLATPKYVVTTDSEHDNPISENILNREFNVSQLGKVWVSDITYIRVNDDWAYLTTVLDLADRKIVGWAISEDMTTENTVIAAWNRAKMNREIKQGFIFHSDRGVQYTSNSFRKILNGNKKVTQSMSRKGNCWDNAVAESFFKTIKHESLNHIKFTSIKQLKRVLFEYIEHWYNRIRMHSALDYKTPFEKELELTYKLKNVA
jgi:putative transposase